MYLKLNSSVCVYIIDIFVFICRVHAQLNYDVTVRCHNIRKNELGEEGFKSCTPTLHIHYHKYIPSLALGAWHPELSGQEFGGDNAQNYI